MRLHPRLMIALLLGCAADTGARIDFPKGIRHGTVFHAPRSRVEKLSQ
ncbi:MAG: hypothetical protein JNL98_38055 [Bryobacterales bacterium]|nr:hypothetical protein [Bryobacterales bacterium]